jgi:hypothetical protein
MYFNKREFKDAEK